MMLKMMNPMGSMPSVPGTGDKEEDSGLTREEVQEQERLRQEAIKAAEKERRVRYKKQDDEREVIRSALRDKYNIDKPANEEEYEDEDEEDGDGFVGARSKEVVEEDPLEEARKMAEKQLNDAKAMAQEKCVLQ